MRAFSTQLPLAEEVAEAAPDKMVPAPAAFLAPCRETARVPAGAL